MSRHTARAFRTIVALALGVALPCAAGCGWFRPAPVPAQDGTWSGTLRRDHAFDARGADVPVWRLGGARGTPVRSFIGVGDPVLVDAAWRPLTDPAWREGERLSVTGTQLRAPLHHPASGARDANLLSPKPGTGSYPDDFMLLIVRRAE